MKLKISGHNESIFSTNLNSFLNVATMICLKGYIPTQHDINNSETRGWWYTKEEDRYNLVSSLNNNWLNIRKTGENYIVVEFSFRHDKDFKKKETISNLMLAWFDFVSEY